MIKFHPKAGQILMCDFECFIAPEMPIASLKYQMGYRYLTQLYRYSLKA